MVADFGLSQTSGEKSQTLGSNFTMSYFLGIPAKKHAQNLKERNLHMVRHQRNESGEVRGQMIRMTISAGTPSLWCSVSSWAASLSGDIATGVTGESHLKGETRTPSIPTLLALNMTI